MKCTNHMIKKLPSFDTALVNCAAYNSDTHKHPKHKQFYTYHISCDLIKYGYTQ